MPRVSKSNISDCARYSCVFITLAISDVADKDWDLTFHAGFTDVSRCTTFILLSHEVQIYAVGERRSRYDYWPGTEEAEKCI